MTDHNTPDAQQQVALAAMQQRIIALEAENAGLRRQVADLSAPADRILSEGLFWQLAENMHDGLAIVKDSQVIYMNRQLSTITGYSLEELKNLQAADLAAPEEKERFAALAEHQQTADTLWLQDLEYWMIRKDGTRCCVRNSYWLNPDDTHIFYILTTDVTERRLSEEALFQSESLYRGIFEGVGDAILVETLDHKIIDANKQACHLYGYSYREMLRLSASDLLPAGEIPLQESIKAGSVVDRAVERVNVRSNGELFPVEVSAHVHDTGLEQVVLVVVRDITERKAVEAALRESEAKFALAFQTTAVSMSIYSVPDDAYLAVNDGFTAMMGYTAEEVIGHSPTEFSFRSHSADPATVRQVLHQKGLVKDIEVAYRPRSGEARTGLLSAHKVVINGKDCMISIMRDITERKAVEAALRQSEDNLAKVFNTIPDAIVISRLSDGLLLNVNDVFYMLLGYAPADDLIGKTTLEVNIWPDPADRQRLLEALARDGVVQNYEVTVQRKDGSQIIGLISSRVFELDNEPCLITVFRDISERIEAQKALRESEERLAKVFRTIPDALAIASVPDGRMLEVNEGFLAHLDYGYEEVLGKTAVEVGIWANLDERRRFTEQLHAQGAVQNYEATFRRKDGSTAVGLASARLLELDDEPYLVIMVRDISDRKEAEAAIRQLNEELEERVQQRTAELETANQYLRQLTAVKDEFVSNVSHELRTPITNLKLHQYLLAAQPENADQHLSILRRETERLARIIEDLLHLSRLDQGAVKMQASPINLNALVEEFVQDRQRMAEENQLTLRSEDYPNAVMVMVDAGLVGQVLSILMTNALHYTPAGGQITVGTTIQQVDGRRWGGFRIWDTGPGVQPEEKDLLFERFYRGSAGQRSEQPGTGLGLALADRIVEQHGGLIEVESSGVPGEGAVFTVWLPM